MVSLPGILPKLLAAKGVAGRETLAGAFFKYFASGLPHDAGQLTRCRYTSLKGRISDEDVARSECVNGLAILSNSAPTAFWVIFHVFSDVEVLERIRAQVNSVTTVEPSTGGQPERRTIHTSKLRELPLFTSLIQETTRYRARGTGPRMAMEDIVLSDDSRQYHIEKGAVVMLAHNAMHVNKDAWGDTADRFKVDRFFPGNKTPTNAFRGFGGGANACPGKSFAVAEIAALVSMMAMRFDIKPVSGEWTEPGQDMSNMARESTPPAKKVWVDIVPRPGMEEVVWGFET
jgi:cytochrome P450